MIAIKNSDKVFIIFIVAAVGGAIIGALHGASITSDSVKKIMDYILNAIIVGALLIIFMHKWFKRWLKRK